MRSTQRKNKDCVVFVGNMIVDFDHEMMARILKVPDGKFRDKVHRTLEENISTIGRELGEEANPRDEGGLNALLTEEFERVLGPMEPRQKDEVPQGKMDALGSKMLTVLFRERHGNGGDKNTGLAGVPKGVGGGRCMKMAEGRMGRVFVIRLEHGDLVPDCIEKFAKEKGISHAQAILIGGIDEGEIVVGPRRSEQRPPEPMTVPIEGVHELAAVGVLAPGEDGKPVLHIHGALGRSGGTKTGCLRLGAKTWVMAEVILYEILDAKATRIRDQATGLAILQPEAAQTA